jgi:glyoxylase-like metal-dependent hydrolase (beta-lactamase superfamily II)
MTVEQPGSTRFGASLHGEPAEYETGYKEVAPHTWAWMQPNGDLGESNSGLVVGGDQALLIDTLWDLRLTRRMLAAARGLTDAVPELPQTVINTHSDGDHFWGNQLLPDAEIISSATAREMMPLDTPREMHRLARASTVLGVIGSLPLPVVGTVGAPRLPRLPSKHMASMFRPFHFAEVALTYPTRTFEERLTVRVGDREAEAVMIGPAHTAGDTMVWLADVSVCFAADVLFVGTTPVMWAGPVKCFIRAINRLLDVDADTYVPGHGPVCGRPEVELVRDYFEWVEREACSRLVRGDSPARVARTLLFSDEFESLAWARWHNPAILVLTLHTEQFVRAGGKGHLPKAIRSRAITRMQLTQAALEDRRAKQR